MGDASASSSASQARSAEERVVELEAQLAALTVERDTIRLAYRNAQQELELLRRRLLLAKAERLDTAQLELELGHKLAALDALSLQLGKPDPQNAPSSGASPASPKDPGAKRKPTGRRDLRDLELPEERIELTDPVLEGRAERIDWDESCQLSWRRAGFVRTVIARAKYRVVEATPDAHRLSLELGRELAPLALLLPGRAHGYLVHHDGVRGMTGVHKSGGSSLSVKPVQRPSTMGRFPARASKKSTPLQALPTARGPADRPFPSTPVRA